MEMAQDRPELQSRAHLSFGHETIKTYANILNLVKIKIIIDPMHMISTDTVDNTKLTSSEIPKLYVYMVLPFYVANVFLSYVALVLL